MTDDIASVLSGGARWAVVHGEALDVLRAMPDESVDAIVTDPPAGIAFMGKEWDHDHGGREGWVRAFAAIFRECLRVLKVGGRALVWSIPRTSHWTACAVEDAGFTIENTIAHIFGSGFPKGKSQIKPAREDWILARKPGGKVPPLQIDRCRVGYEPNPRHEKGGSYARRNNQSAFFGAAADAPTDPEPAGRWPPNLVLSHAEGCKQVGTRRVISGMHIGRNCEGVAVSVAHGQRTKDNRDAVGYADADGLETVAAWDCVDGCPVKALDEQSGWLAGRGNTTATRRTGGKYNAFGEFRGCERDAEHWHDNIGGTASRFFPQFEPDPLDGAPFLYAAKASRRERNAGCEGLPERVVSVWGGEDDDLTPGKKSTVAKGNHHPTVKPQALMRWLVRLICPPGGLVLDPFNGSGSTGVAALTDGFRYIGIEREAEYVEIARARIAHVRPMAPVIPIARARPTSKPTPAPAPAPPRQLTLGGIP